MNSTQEEKLKALASELAKDIKTGEDLSALSSQLVKLTVEAALGAEMERHLGYPKHSPEGHNTGNSRNGTTEKTLKPKILPINACPNSCKKIIGKNIK